MKILVFGNIGSGKTTILRKLNDVFPSWEIVAIDDYRRKYSNGSKEKELMAQKHFFEAIKTDKIQFVECIGVGNVSEELFSILSKKEEILLCIKLVVPKEICKERLKSRVWDIPFPEPLKKVDSLIDKIDLKIHNGAIEDLWCKNPKVKIIAIENIQINNIDKIILEIKTLLKNDKIKLLIVNDIQIMLSNSIQNYYGKEYLTYQKNVIEKSREFLEDKLMISNFISILNINGNILDIGSGNCQWFPLFEKKINHYYAIEANKTALSKAPPNAKLISINKNIFEKEFKLIEAIPSKIDCAFFSFFLSHFSDSAIIEVFKKLDSIDSILIVDTLWSKKHKSKYKSKNLSYVKRRTSENSLIMLPKRFFERSDIENMGLKFKYKISKFISGNYWFACLLQKNS